MQQSDAPSKIRLAWAANGTKNTIPVASQISVLPGAASYNDGFPPLTMTPVVAGGIPPSGNDFNGILNALSAIDRWNSAGAGYVYDATFAADTNVGGYPAGARVLRTDGLGYWLNTVDNNASDPEAGGAGWVPDVAYGSASVAMSGSNVTLTPLQASKRIIVITGTLTADVNLILPAWVREWLIVNNASGAFTVTVKTASGSGVAIPSGSMRHVWGDGTDIKDDNSAAMVGSANQLLATNGYQKLPGGLILQWGQFTTSGASAQTVTFPIAFPNACFGAIASNNSSGAAAASWPSTGGYTTTQMTITCVSSANTFAAAGQVINYFAIGR